MNKTLYELGLEYLEEIKLLEEKINKYRQRLNKATAASNIDEVFTARRLLSVLYKEKSELVLSAKKLLNYYS